MAEDSSASPSLPPVRSSSPQARPSAAADDTKLPDKAAGAHQDAEGDNATTAGKKGEVKAKKRNGNTNEHIEGKSDKATGEDIEITDTAYLDDSEKKPDNEPEENAGKAKGVTPRTNGAPGSNKKVKRKSLGVPEHKAKLNKKKSMPVLVDRDCQPGEYYFARMKGFPKWPCIISDDEMLPPLMIRSRPVTAKRLDGTYREGYGPGGPRAHDRSFPIMFLQSNEFAWMQNKDLEPLDPDTIGDAPEKGKNKSLIKAYQIAAEKHDLQHFKTVIEEHNRALAEDQERKDAKGKGKGKGKMKTKDAHTKGSDSEAPVDELADEMEFDEDETDGKAKSKSKKRKKDAESEEETNKPAKTPKRPKKAAPTTTKLKLTTPKTPNGIAGRPVSGPKSAKQKTPSSKKSKAKANEDGDMEDASESPKVETKPQSMEAQRQKKEKEILYFRHRLQKGFLTRDQMPKEEEMETMGGYITKLEAFTDLEGSIIRTTKIHKVLRAIIKLSSIPRDEEFQFKKRSHDLLAIWNKILASEPETPTAASGTDKDGPATNGVGKDGKAEEKDEEEGGKSASEGEKEKDADGDKQVGPVRDADEGGSDAGNTDAKIENDDEQEAEMVTS